MYVFLFKKKNLHIYYVFAFLQKTKTIFPLKQSVIISQNYRKNPQLLKNPKLNPSSMYVMVIIDPFSRRTFPATMRFNSSKSLRQRRRSQTSARVAVRMPMIGISGFGSAKPSSSCSSETTESAMDVAVDRYTELGRDFRSGERISAAVREVL